MSVECGLRAVGTGMSRESSARRLRWGELLMPVVPGPVLALGVTQIIGFGSLYYAFGVLVAPMSTDLAISPTLAYGLLSVALLAGSLAAPLAGRLVDRRGARVMMAAGSVASAFALAAVALAPNWQALLAALILAEVVAPLVLYDAAFAALAEAAGQARARLAITQMTLLGGFASTLFWPLTLWLQTVWGWREAFLVFAALHLLVCLPLHLTLPRSGATGHKADPTPPPFAPLPARHHRRAMALLAVGLSVGWVVFSAFSAQWVPALTALGLTEGAAVAAGALMGPAQVGARVIEMVFAAHRHPIFAALIAMTSVVLALIVLILGPSGILTASVFAVLFGVGQGLGTVVRGTLPLALFGPLGFGARLGQLASLRMLVAALAPFAMAGSLALFGPMVTLILAAVLAQLALAAYGALPWRATE